MAHAVLINDSRPARDLLRRMLAPAGVTLTGVGALPEALEVIRRERPDVVVVDQNTPGRDCVAWVREVRSHPEAAHIPIVVVTSSALRDVIVRLARLGVQGVIVKNERFAVEVVRRVLSLVGRAEPAGGEAEASTPTVVTAQSSPVLARPLESSQPVVASGEEPPRAGGARTPTAAEDDIESLRASVLQLDGDPLQIEQAIQELKNLKPLMSRSDIMDRISEGGDLRALKPAVQQVLHLTGSSAASIDTIAKAIKQDQALSLKVLKISNSPLYTRGERVETVQKAVARIGVAQIRTTVMSLSVIDRFGNASLAGRIKADWFWEHSIACGLIASKIAAMRGLGTDAADSMFTAGLLHDVGRAIYAERLAEEYAGVIAVADQLELPLETVESRLLLVNHADLTDRLLRTWNFSADLVNPIALHHLSVGNIRRTAPKMAESVATLGLANRLAHALVLGGSGNEVVYPIEEFVQFLGLKGEQIQELAGAIPELAFDMKVQMLQHGAAPQPSLLDEARGMLSGPVRPLHVALDPTSDAVGMLLGRVADQAPAGEPNLAVVRVTHTRERAQLMAMLRDAEERAGVKGLPTLVVGAGPACQFAEGALGDRRMAPMVMPFRLSRLLRGINTLVFEREAAAA